MLLSFVIASCLITLMPGPSMLMVMMNSLQRNLAAGVQTALGVVVADAMLLVLTLSGIGALLHTSALAFTLLKWCGVAYLLYLGVKQLLTARRTSAGKPDTPDNSKPQVKPGHAFVQGFGITMLNPKIIGFFIAFFPQFLDHSQSVVSQLLLLGPLFLLIVFVILVFYGVIARSARLFLDSAKGQAVVGKISGWMLVGCGLFATTMER